MLPVGGFRRLHVCLARRFLAVACLMTEFHHFRPARPAVMLAGVLCLCLILLAELALSARQQSQTWDEAYHLLAGLRYWQRLDFGINPEHPPLVKCLASIPLLPLQLRIPAMPQGTSKYEGFVAARKFLYANNADDLLFRGRMAASILVLLLALLLFEAAHRMFGAGPAFLALTLFVFEPNLLAHGALVTTDMALACLLFAAVYAFYRYVKQPSIWRLVACGFMAGLVLAAKHSGILLFPILGSLAFVEILVVRPARPEADTQPAKTLEGMGRHACRMAGALLLITLIAVAVLWAFYAFRFRARPDSLKMTPSLADYVRGVNNPGLKSAAQSRVLLGLERWRVLPESYLYGSADVLIVSAGPRPSYLFGKLYPQGRWFYFPAVFVIKSTLGFLLLLLLSLAARKLYRVENLREILFVSIPPALYFAISLTSGLNVGVRHILPVYPFLLVLAAAGAWTVAKAHRGWAYAAAALMGLHVLSSLRSFPDYLAYSNEVWGGPANTYRVLTDSNVDWGQGLKATKRYLDRHHITDCWLAYFGSADPDYYQIPCKLLPDVFAVWWGKPVDVVPPVFEGTVLIGATQMAAVYWGPEELNPYEQFLGLPPADSIGGSIQVFSGRFDLALASQWSRLNKAWQLLADRHLDQATAESRAIVKLAPRMTYAHYTLGYMLAQAKQKDEARREYELALSLARAIHPEYQWFWIPFLERQLAQL